MGVSKNKGTPKSSILIGFSIINHPFWWVFPLFLETPIWYQRNWFTQPEQGHLFPGIPPSPLQRLKHTKPSTNFFYAWKKVRQKIFKLEEMVIHSGKEKIQLTRGCNIETSLDLYREIWFIGDRLSHKDNAGMKQLLILDYNLNPCNLLKKSLLLPMVSPLSPSETCRRRGEILRRKSIDFDLDQLRPTTSKWWTVGRKYSLQYGPPAS